MGRSEADFLIDVCLAVPPFHSMHTPALGASVLKSACEARGFRTRVLYGNMLLAARTGLEHYDNVCKVHKAGMMGERLFRPFAYPPETLARMAEPEPLAGDLQVVHDFVATEIPQALDEFVDQVLALRPRILGITSTFEQNLAASALALRVKERAPEICIVLGGANVAWPMGRGLAEVFPWIDYFFSGESDVDFPEFCDRWVRKGERPSGRIICSEPIADLSVVSAPDFGDYFAALRPFQAAGTLPEWLPRFLMMESSRGCWWGAKQHCTFCGLNGDGMDFRDKPATRVLNELAELSKWQVGHISMADNIMPRHYLTDLLPLLADMEPRVSLFYEVKANLTEENIEVMTKGGVVKIQPGIESLSSNVLRLMRKGVSAHQNIALLRNCAGIGMWVIWILLYGFPGEAAEDYEAMISLMPLIEHLQPPGSTHTIIIDRFSPYFRDPEGMGIGPIEPFRSYDALYPPEADLREIAYHFTGNYRTELFDNPALLDGLRAAVDRWRQVWSRKLRPLLQAVETDVATFILDTRQVAQEKFTLIPAEKYSALLYFERPHSRSGLSPEIEEHVEWLLARNFLIEHEGKLLSVVVRKRQRVDHSAVAPHAMRAKNTNISPAVPS